MKLFRHLLTGLLLAPAGWLSATCQTLDPSFAPASIYATSDVKSSFQQADGKIVISGALSRINGVPTGAVARFNTNGTLDAAFQQNVGTPAPALVDGVERLSNGQMMLLSFSGTPVTAGGITRTGLLRLNADGTGDASFDAGTGPAGYLRHALQLPNGQLLVIGYFTTFNGATANSIVRLNANGSVDASFNSGTGADDEVESIALLPSGKVLIGGYFSTYNGNSCNGLVRLNADGSYDATFTAALQPGEETDQIAVQPDGRIIIGGGINDTLLRLMPDGSADNTFVYPRPTLFPNYVYSGFGTFLIVQPDGKILISSGQQNGSTFPMLARLNPNGTVDQSFQIGTGPDSTPRSIALLANGGVLVAGRFTNFNGTTDRQLVLLNSSGAVDASFQPLIQNAGTIANLVRQADGKLIVSGTFYQINGQPTRRLARFNVNGTLDAAYTPALTAITPIVDLAIQPDGRLLVATSNSVQRLLPTGSLDNTFVTPNLNGSFLSRMLLQADGRILVGGQYYNLNGTRNTQGLLRLMPNGSLDGSFALNSTGAGRLVQFQTMAQQPDGKLLVAGTAVPLGSSASIRTVLRLESTGAVDASFTSGAFSSSFLNSMVIQSDGKVLVGGGFTTYAGTNRSNVVRLNANGTLDTSFAPPTQSGMVIKVVLQPNGRVLLVGNFNSPSLPNNLARLLANGQADASFAATAVPNGTVNGLLVQPDGAIVVAGSFTTIAGQPIMALARITAPNVLHAAAPRAVAERTEAWPVPAHTGLNVAFAPAAHPQALDVLDLVGRLVLHQNVQGQPSLTLAVAGLAAGTYVLRVTYAEGTVTRRVQIQ